jgi:hypothetical protein
MNLPNLLNRSKKILNKEYHLEITASKFVLPLLQRGMANPVGQE